MDVKKTDRGKNGKKKKNEDEKNEDEKNEVEKYEDEKNENEKNKDKKNENEKNENEKNENSQTSEFNIKKNIMTTFKNYLFEKIEKYHIKLTNIPYKVYTQGTKNYLMIIFNLSIRNFLTQPLPDGENPNKDKLTIDKIKDKKLKEILQMNFLEMFYEFYREIKFDKKIVKEEWKKIIEYKKEMKENEEYDYKKYGIYAYINEKKGRKAQYEYNILNKKTKRDSNSNIKSDNQFNDQKKTNQNVNYNSSLNNNENIPSSNNIHKDGTFNNDSNIVQTNQNVNSNLSLNNNENNIEFNETLNNYSFNLTEENDLSNISFLRKEISNGHNNDIYFQMFDKEISK